MVPDTDHCYKVVANSHKEVQNEEEEVSVVF